MSEKYPVKWRGETYYASDLTDDRKHKYCVWLYGHMLANAKKYKTAKEYLEFDRKLTASPPEWTSVPGMDVLESFGTEAGQKQLMRIVLDLDVEAMSDDDLNKMVQEKEADPASDFNIAMNLIRANADPKAQPGGPGSPRPEVDSEPTPPSATSPSDSGAPTLAT